jgi:hypothetical protein
MNQHDNLIIIGGTGRNIGKTTLMEKIIKRFAREVPVTALKIANIKPGEEAFHGHDVSGFSEKILLQKESNPDGNKDSMRFLKAGASVSWYIQAEDAFLPETFPEVEKILKNARFGICESNSLRLFVRPALFIMVKGKSASPRRKKEASRLLEMADVTVEALNPAQFDALVKAVEIKDGRFVLNKEAVGF